MSGGMNIDEKDKGDYGGADRSEDGVEHEQAIVIFSVARVVRVRVACHFNGKDNSTDY